MNNIKMSSIKASILDSAIILAGGKGTRMGVPDKHKSTFEINGTPAILRLIQNLRKAIIQYNIVVVGAYSNQIMEVISSSYLDVTYSFQAEQRGTGNAAKCGLRTLKQSQFPGNVFILAGDAYVETEVLEHLKNQASIKESDLAILVKKKADSPYSGRVICDSDKKIIAVIEYWDIMKAIFKKKFSQTLEKYNSIEQIGTDKQLECCHELANELYHMFKTEKKIKQLFSTEIEGLLTLHQDSSVDKSELIKANKLLNPLELLNNLKRLLNGTSEGFILNGIFHDAELLENSAEYVNISVYYGKASHLYGAVEKILANNAQNEEYLTDIIEIMAGEGKKVIAVPVLKSENVMSFNNPQELLEINNYVIKKESDSNLPQSCLSHTNFKQIREWIHLFSTQDPRIVNHFQGIYGNNDDNFSNQISMYLRTLEAFASKISKNENVFIVRAPGRINLMGRHIDHRGGDVNMFAINAEVILVVSPRDDDSIVAYNFDNQTFPPRHFKISEFLKSVEWEDWFGFISNNKINQIVRDSNGDWMNYLKAAALRLQASLPNLVLKGMNMYVVGNLPQAAGLSSSSTLVVGCLESLIAINNLNISTKDFVDICGEGEWFVGTRGGCADHAAIKTSNQGQVTRIGFFPFQIKDTVDFPKNYDILIINSMKKAQKSNTELKKYNEKVLAYEIGFEIIKKEYPQYQEKLKFLRDINEENLGLTQNDIIEMIKRIPNEVKFGNLNQILPANVITNLKNRFKLFSEEDLIPLRSVILFGISECVRSKRCIELLRNGDMKEFGRLMNISHDGDRVVYFNDFTKESKSNLYNINYTDEKLQEIIDNDINLENISGSYACSIPEIDFIVDYLRLNEHALGAQISGAGLGGCVMALIESNHSDSIMKSLSEIYREKWNLNLQIIRSKPIMGTTIINIP